MEGWVDLGYPAVHRSGVKLRESNSRSLHHKSDALTTTLLSHRAIVIIATTTFIATTTTTITAINSSLHSDGVLDNQIYLSRTYNMTITTSLLLLPPLLLLLVVVVVAAAAAAAAVVFVVAAAAAAAAAVAAAAVVVMVVVSGWTLRSPPWCTSCCPAWHHHTWPQTVGSSQIGLDVDGVRPTRGHVSSVGPAASSVTDVLLLWNSLPVQLRQAEGQLRTV